MGWGASWQSKMGGSGCGPVPGPTCSLTIEHAELVIDTVRGHLMMAPLLLLSSQVAQNPVDGGYLNIGLIRLIRVRVNYLRDK